jgi:methylmalonyl-CoA/ethylmalonyl-CoA epimerase
MDGHDTLRVPGRSHVAIRPNLRPSVRRIGRVHHVALVVRSIDSGLAFWRDTLGLELESVTDVSSDRVRIAFLTVGESKVELVEPTDDTTGVARFLASRGEGFHHVCFEVENLAETLIRLEIDGLELIDTAPRRGAEGPVAFIHPRSCGGVLVELIEEPGGPAWRTLGFGVTS